MAEIGSLSIAVDVSSISGASTRIETFAQKLDKLAASLSAFKAALELETKAMKGMGDEAARLSSIMGNVGGVAKNMTNAFGGQATRIGLAAKALERWNQAGAAAGKVTIPTAPPKMPGGAGGKGGGGGSSAAEGIFGLMRNNVGMSISAEGGINPFARSMVTLPPQLEAVVLAAGLAGGALKFVSETVVSMGIAVVETGIRFQRLTSMLTVAAGSREGAAGEMSYVVDTAMRLGLNLEKAAEGYGKFKVAATLAGMAGGQVKKVFESVAMASTAMGLTSSDSSRIFLALEQMLSKGKITAEELRKQLGNSLPGAMGLMAEAAKSAGVSVSGSVGELEKLMKAGKLISKDILPFFAIEVNKAFGSGFAANSDNLMANLNRLETAWTVFMKTVAEIGIMDATNTVVKQLSGTIREWGESLQKVLDTLEGQKLVSEFRLLGEAAKQVVLDAANLFAPDSVGAVTSFSGAIRVLTEQVRGLSDTLQTSKDAWMSFKEIFSILNTVNPIRIGLVMRDVVLETLDAITGMKAATDAFVEADAKLSLVLKKRADRRALGRDLATNQDNPGFQGPLSTPVNKAAEAEAESAMRKRSAFMETQIVKYYQVTGLQKKEESIERQLITLGFQKGTQEWRFLSGIMEMQASILEGKKANSAQDKIDHQNMKDRADIAEHTAKIFYDSEKRADKISPYEFTPSSNLKNISNFGEAMNQKMGRGKTLVSGLGFSEAIAQVKEFDGTIAGMLEHYRELLTVNEMFGTTLGKVWGEASRTLEDYGRSMSDLAVDWVSGLMSSTETGEQAFRRMTSSMLQQLAKMIFYYGVLVPLVKSVFGGGSADFSSSSLGAIQPAYNANGGSVTAGVPSIVGERGPELFVPGRSGAIVPNNALSRTASNNVTVSVYVTPGEAKAETKGGSDPQQSAAFGKMLGDAVRAVLVDESRPNGYLSNLARGSR